MKILILSLPLLVSACYKVEVSDLQQEKVIVISRAYHPSRTDITPHIDDEGDVTLSTDYIPESFDTTFQCQHGIFTTHRQEIYARCREGEEWIALYRDVYHRKYKDGKMIAEEHVDFQLADIVKEVKAEK